MNNTFINNVTQLAISAAGALTGGSAGAAIGTLILPGAVQPSVTYSELDW